MDAKVQELKKRIEELEKEIKNTKQEHEGKKVVKKEPFTSLKVLYTWKSPERVFMQRDKPWYLKISAGALFLVLIAAFLQDPFIILVICIFVLVAFLLASIPPQKVDHEITNKGVRSFKELYQWDNLDYFWVAEKLGQMVVYIKTKMKFPSKLMMIIGDGDEKTIVRILGEHLEYKEYNEKQGWVSKKSDGVMVNPTKYESLFKEKIKKGDVQTSSKELTEKSKITQN